MHAYFNFLNSNEYFFYTLLKVIINHLIQITQKINIKLQIINVNIYIVSFELQYMLDGDKKKFMKIILKFYIIINKIYLYNYNDKITI